MSWHHDGLLAFDVETTGVDVETARIVTAATAEVGREGVRRQQAWLIDPGVEIPDEAAAVHGITTERARAEGVKAANAVHEISRALAGAGARGLPIVAMNARFDLTILDRECRRHRAAPPVVPCVIDPYVLDKHLDRYRRGSRKLDAICAHYRVDLDDAHEASADAIAAARVAWRIATTTALGEMTPDEIHAAQIGWAHEQAVSLAEYFASRGRPEHVEPAWPVVPLPEEMAA